MGYEYILLAAAIIVPLGVFSILKGSDSTPQGVATKSSLPGAFGDNSPSKSKKKKQKKKSGAAKSSALPGKQEESEESETEVAAASSPASKKETRVETPFIKKSTVKETKASVSNGTTNKKASTTVEAPKPKNSIPTSPSPGAPKSSSPAATPAKTIVPDAYKNDGKKVNAENNTSKPASVENWKKQKQEQNKELLAKQQEQLQFAAAAAKNSVHSSSSSNITSIPGPGAMGNNKKKNRSNASAGLSHSEFPTLGTPEPKQPKPKMAKQPVPTKVATPVVKQESEEESSEEEKVSEAEQEQEEEEEEENWTTVEKSMPQARSGGIDFSKPMDPWVAQQQQQKLERIAAADPHGEQTTQFARVLSIKPTVKEERIREAIPDGFSTQKSRSSGSSGGFSQQQSTEITKKQRENLAKAAKRKEEKAAEDALQEQRRLEHMRQVKAEKMKEFYRSQSKKQAPVDSRWTAPKGSEPSSSAVSGGMSSQVNEKAHHNQQQRSASMDIDEEPEEDSVELVAEPPVHRFLQHSKAMLPSPLAKKQGKGIPIAVPTAERRQSSYHPSYHSALVTGARDNGGVFGRKLSTPLTKMSPTKGNHRDFAVVGKAPGYEDSGKRDAKKLPISEADRADENEKRDQPQVKRKKLDLLHPTSISAPAGSMVSQLKKHNASSALTAQKEKGEDQYGTITNATKPTSASSSIVSSSSTSKTQQRRLSGVRKPGLTSPLTEKAKQLGSGAFPQVKLESVWIADFKQYSFPDMWMQFAPGKIVINIDGNPTTIQHKEIRQVKCYPHLDEYKIKLSTKGKLHRSSILAKHYDPAGEFDSLSLTVLTSSRLKVKNWMRKLATEESRFIAKPLSSLDDSDRISLTEKSFSITASTSSPPSPTSTSAANSPSLQARRFKPDEMLFTYPFKVVGRSKQIAVQSEDLSRLDDGEFLNDTILEFGLKYIHTNLEKSNPEVAHQTYIFNTFFYQRLVSKPLTGKYCSYDAVKSWTNRVDIFSKKYIVIPIHENLHWYLAIITNPGLLLEQGPAAESTESSPGGDLELSPLVGSNLSVAAQPSDEKEIGPLGPSAYLDDGKADNGDGLRSETSNNASPSSSPLPGSPKLSKESRRNKNGDKSLLDSILDERLHSKRKLRSASAIPLDPYDRPYIIILDSIDGYHSGVFKTLRSYLQQELLTRKLIDKNIGSVEIGGKYALKCPKQQNHCDCGLYLLHYTEVFLQQPGVLLDGILNKFDGDSMWNSSKLPEKREHYRNIVLDIADQYREQLQPSDQQKSQDPTDQTVACVILPAAS